MPRERDTITGAQLWDVLCVLHSGEKSTHPLGRPGKILRFPRLSMWRESSCTDLCATSWGPTVQFRLTLSAWS